MARRNRMPADPVADYGAQPWRVELEDTPDPDAPNRTIRRARGYDPLRTIESLDTALFLAAERFRNCYALAMGAREGSGAVRLEPWQRCLYSARVADARAEVEGSLRAVGLRLAGAFNLAVAYPLTDEGREDPQPMTMRRIERRLRVRNGNAAELIREALERLRDYQTEIGC